MPVIRPAGAAAGWSARNVSAEALRRFSSRYVRLRYEDLTADPDAALAKVLGGHRFAHPLNGSGGGGAIFITRFRGTRCGWTPGPSRSSPTSSGCRR